MIQPALLLRSLSRSPSEIDFDSRQIGKAMSLTEKFAISDGNIDGFDVGEIFTMGRAYLTGHRNGDGVASPAGGGPLADWLKVSRRSPKVNTPAAIKANDRRSTAVENEYPNVNIFPTRVGPTNDPTPVQMLINPRAAAAADSPKVNVGSTQYEGPNP